MSLNFTHTRLECLQQEELPERLELLGPEVPDGLLEGVLPHVELDDLEMVEDLHDLAEPAVLVDQVVLLAPVHPPRGEDAHQNDDSQAEEAWNVSSCSVPDRHTWHSAPVVQDPKLLSTAIYHLCQKIIIYRQSDAI